MKKVYISFLFVFIFSAVAIQAQITMDNSYFPALGDSISTVTIIPETGDIQITDSGIDQLWDYSGVGSGVTSTTVYTSATATDTSDVFLDADLAIVGTGGTTYFRSTANVFEVLGFEGQDPTGFGINLVSRFSPALSELTAPLEFLDFDTYSSASDVVFGTDALPSDIFDGLAFTPDSIRVRTTIDRVDLVDAYGTVKLPSSNSFETLRQKRVQLTESRLEVKVPILDWVDVTEQFIGTAGGVLGMDTTVTFTHWALDIKEPIAVLTLDAEEQNVISFTYKSEDTMTSTEASGVIEQGFENVYAYPNPAITYAKFECVNLRPDYYDLKIYNILGLEAYSENSFISGNKMIEVDLSSFRKGTYLYSLMDTTGKVITTKRLVVIKP